MKIAVIRKPTHHGGTEAQRKTRREILVLRSLLPLCFKAIVFWYFSVPPWWICLSIFPICFASFASFAVKALLNAYGK